MVCKSGNTYIFTNWGGARYPTTTNLVTFLEPTLYYKYYNGLDEYHGILQHAVVFPRYNSMFHTFTWYFGNPMISSWFSHLHSLIIIRLVPSNRSARVSDLALEIHNFDQDRPTGVVTEMIHAPKVHNYINPKKFPALIISVENQKYTHRFKHGDDL